MSRYRKVEVRMWGDDKFRRLSPLQPSGQALWLYLICGPATGPIPGLFKAGPASMAEDLGWSVEAFREAFREVSREGMVKADFKARVVWLPKAIEHNPPANPNIVTSWWPEFELIPECSLKWEALESMKSNIYTMSDGFISAFDKAFGKALAKALANGMANQDQEQKQKQKQKQEAEAEAEASGLNPVPSRRDSTTRTTKNAYPPDFEQAWSAYPKRAGGNSKAMAFKAWKARIKSGIDPGTMLLGVMRYAAYIDMTGKVGTEYVQQAATFFGPAEHFNEPWDPPQQINKQAAVESSNRAALEAFSRAQGVYL